MTGDPASNEPDVESLRSRPPGRDPEDPYEDVDISVLPDWWADAVRQFESHGLRPFRPSRFANGALAYHVVDRLETELDVTIRIVGIDVEYGDDWTVFVDDEPVDTVPRRRSRQGYTIFGISSDEFESLVRTAHSESNAN